jgi:hypothetical protein
MTLTAEKPWRKAKRFFESHFDGETFAETVLKNFDGGLVYSDDNCFVLAQEARTDGEDVNIHAERPNAWYVQLAAAGSEETKLSDIVGVLPRAKKFICFHRGAKNRRLKCYDWARFNRKVGL